MPKNISVNSRDGVVGTATRHGLDGPGLNPGGRQILRARPERLRCQPSLLYNGCRVFPEAKRPGSGGAHPPPSNAGLRMGWRCTSTSPLCRHRHCTSWGDPEFLGAIHYKTPYE